MPERIAFRMNLNAGQAAEYEKRHDEIFPELVEALKARGHLRLHDLARPGDEPSLRHPDPRRRSHPGPAARHGDHEALVEAHGRHHGDRRQQRAGAGPAEARLLTCHDARRSSPSRTCASTRSRAAARAATIFSRSQGHWVIDSLIANPMSGYPQISREAVELGHRRARLAGRRDRDGGWRGRRRDRPWRRAGGLADQEPFRPLRRRARMRATSTGSGTRCSAPRFPTVARAYR